MAAFNATNFAYNTYASSRPDYPPSLYALILSYHTGPRTRLLDLGCGHGTVTRALAPHFTNLTGTDPSDGMLDEARRITSTAGTTNITFLQGTAESLPAIPDKSVDLAVAGQAAHWFPYPPDEPSVWDELTRVVKPGGTVAFWGYADPLFPGCDAASAVLHKWAYRKGEVAPGWEAMGGYWSFLGRARIEGLYGTLPVAGEGETWTDVRWVRHDRRVGEEWYRDVEELVGGKLESKGREAGVTEDEKAALKMEKRMSVGAVKRFVRTWSGYHNWRGAHGGNAVARAEGGSGDVVDWAFDEIAGMEEVWRDEEHEVDVEWPVAMLLLRRK